MAVCCICNKKLGRHVEGHMFSSKYNDLILCDTCHANKEKLCVNTNGDIEVIQKSRQYFEDYLSIGMVAVEAREPLKELLLEAEAAEKESLKYRFKNKSFMATTGEGFEGYRIVAYKDVVDAEVVLSTNAFTSLGGQISDISGKTNGMVTQKISDAKDDALEALKQKAALEGGNAIIGVRYGMMNLLDNMLVVSASGTSVVIEK